MDIIEIKELFVKMGKMGINSVKVNPSEYSKLLQTVNEFSNNGGIPNPNTYSPVKTMSIFGIRIEEECL